MASLTLSLSLLLLSCPLSTLVRESFSRSHHTRALTCTLSPTSPYPCFFHVNSLAAACSVGGAQACFDLSREYVKVRRQFGQPLSSLQVSLSLSLTLCVCVCVCVYVGDSLSFSSLLLSPLLFSYLSPPLFLSFSHPPHQSTQFTLAEMAADMVSSRQVRYLSSLYFFLPPIQYLFISLSLYHSPPFSFSLSLTFRQLVRTAARMIDSAHAQKTSFCAMAKFFATEKCYHVLFLHLTYTRTRLSCTFVYFRKQIHTSSLLINSSSYLRYVIPHCNYTGGMVI